MTRSSDATNQPAVSRMTSLSSEMGRRLAVRRRAGREGSWHVDGKAAREIGQSKVVKDRFEEIRDLVAWAGAQRLNRDRNARQVDRAHGVGLVLARRSWTGKIEDLVDICCDGLSHIMFEECEAPIALEPRQ